MAGDCADSVRVGQFTHAENAPHRAFSASSLGERNDLPQPLVDATLLRRPEILDDVVPRFAGARRTSDPKAIRLCDTRLPSGGSALDSAYHAALGLTGAERYILPPCGVEEQFAVFELD